MRRTCAKLCRESGGDLEQIQFLLSHASIQTTERYLGSRQNLKEAVNDRLARHMTTNPQFWSTFATGHFRGRPILQNLTNRS